MTGNSNRSFVDLFEVLFAIQAHGKLRLYVFRYDNSKKKKLELELQNVDI